MNNLIRTKVNWLLLIFQQERSCGKERWIIWQIGLHCFPKVFYSIRKEWKVLCWICRQGYRNGIKKSYLIYWIVRTINCGLTKTGLRKNWNVMRWIPENFCGLGKFPIHMAGIITDWLMIRQGWSFLTGCTWLILIMDRERVIRW